MVVIKRLTATILVVGSLVSFSPVMATKDGESKRTSTSRTANVRHAVKKHVCRVTLSAHRFLGRTIATHAGTGAVLGAVFGPVGIGAGATLGVVSGLSTAAIRYLMTGGRVSPVSPALPTALPVVAPIPALPTALPVVTPISALPTVLPPPPALPTALPVVPTALQTNLSVVLSAVQTAYEAEMNRLIQLPYALPKPLALPKEVLVLLQIPPSAPPTAVVPTVLPTALPIEEAHEAVAQEEETVEPSRKRARPADHLPREIKALQRKTLKSLTGYDLRRKKEKKGE